VNQGLSIKIKVKIFENSIFLVSKFLLDTEPKPSQALTMQQQGRITLIAGFEGDQLGSAIQAYDLHTE
jgi:hypothetical protein